MVPLYIFYSMFGFQRTADSIWRRPTSGHAGS
jgi:pyruvate dehydrogenase complex dehydrogenase (E1) component